MVQELSREQIMGCRAEMQLKGQKPPYLARIFNGIDKYVTQPPVLVEVRGINSGFVDLYPLNPQNGEGMIYCMPQEDFLKGGDSLVVLRPVESKEDF